MAQTQTYYYCNGTTPTSITVTFTEGTCDNQSMQYLNGYESQKGYKNLTVSIPYAISQDLVIRYSFVEHINSYNHSQQTTIETFTNSYSITIPAGQTTASYYSNQQQQMCYDYTSYSTDQSTIATYDTWTLLAGGAVNCAPPPPTCTLAITGVTITNETVRGQNDGAVTIGIHGQVAGTVNYQLTSAYNVYQNTTGIFTGLYPTTYQVFVYQGSCHASSQVNVLQGEFKTGNFNTIQPSLISASENPIVFTIGTHANQIAPKNTEIQFTIVSGSTIPNNASIQFLLTYPQPYTNTFYAKGYPNQTNYFLASVLTQPIGLAIGTNTVVDIAVSLAEAMQKDAMLPRLFYINNVNNTITLSAKFPTSQTNLNNSNVLISTTGITMTTIQQGADAYEGSGIQNYGLYTEIYVDDTQEFGKTPNLNNFNRVAELYLPYNQTNIMQFRLDEVLKTFVSTPKIDFTFSGITTLSSNMCPYYVNYGETYPLIVNTNTIKKHQKGSTNNNIKYVINSALPWESANNMQSYLGNYNPTGSTSQVITGATFLTNSPNPKLIQRQSTEFLYFVMPANYQYPTELRGDIYFYDGTQIINYKFFNIFTGTTNFGGVIAMNVGYDKLGLHNLEVSGMTTRKIKRIDFAVHQLSGTVQYSVTKSYIYAVDDALRRFGVAFQNKLGGYDIFDFTGIVENTLDRVAGSYQVPRQIQSDGSSPLGFNSKSTYNTQETKTITVNSGWLNTAHYLWLQELLASNKIYDYTDSNQPYLNITAFTYKKSSLEDLFDMEITFMYTLQESNINI
jgi:hypothetical protein